MYSSQRVAERGSVLGIDIQKIDHNKHSFPQNVRILDETDMMAWVPSKADFDHFDVVLSDAAPNTTGAKELDSHSSFNLCAHALYLSSFLTRPCGCLIVKIFQGSEFESLVRRFRLFFEEVHIFKPKSSRSESYETFIIGRRWKKPRQNQELLHPPPSEWLEEDVSKKIERDYLTHSERK